MMTSVNCLILGEASRNNFNVAVGESHCNPATDYLNKRPRLDFNNTPLDLGRSPTPLLYTGGCSWDYQESPELEQELRKEVRGLYNVFKEDRHDPKLEPRFQKALIFNISLENGTRINTAEELNANDIIAKRMLYQLQNQGLHWVNIRDDKQPLSTVNILERCVQAIKTELYRGVFGTVSTKNIEVRLKKLSVCQAQEQFPCLKLTEKGTAKSIPWEEGEVVVVNGASAEWGDSFRVLQTVQGDRLFSIHQAKYDYNSATYTLNNLYKEVIKNYVTSINTKKELFDKLAKHRHITIVFTTQPFYETVSCDECFIISRSNFEQYFGPVFSSRATFALTKNINPNHKGW
ncbi:unnamed protein product [Rhizophagus irregularis]|nr:unnamed protein product [Rhizophagus irregularis]